MSDVPQIQESQQRLELIPPSSHSHAAPVDPALEWLLGGISSSLCWLFTPLILGFISIISQKLNNNPKKILAKADEKTDHQ